MTRPSSSVRRHARLERAAQQARAIKPGLNVERSPIFCNSARHFSLLAFFSVRSRASSSEALTYSLVLPSMDGPNALPRKTKWADAVGAAEAPKGTTTAGARRERA